MRKMIPFIALVITSYTVTNANGNLAVNQQAVPWEIAQKDPAFAPDAARLAIDAILDLDNSTSCTGQLISNTGHFLTAFHCVYRSILNQGPQVTIKTSDEIKFKSLEVSDFSKFPFQTQTLESSSRYLRINNDLEDPVIVMTGRGYFEIPPLIQNDREFSVISGNANNLKMYQEDYALLHYSQERVKKQACVKTQTQKPASGSRAWAVGFPANFQFGMSIAIKHVARGVVLNSFDELRQLTGQDVAYAEEAWLDFDRYFLFTGRAVNGMSGGGIIDEQGKLIGHVVAAGSAGFTIGQRADFVKQSLTKQIGPKAVQAAFNCQ